MDRRALLLPVAAVAIAALSVWRMQQENVRRSRPRPVPTLRNLRPAPSFLLTTQSGGRAKLAAYLGRTRVVLYFTGGAGSLATAQAFSAVAAAQPGIAGAGAQLVVVTPAPPQEVRRLQEARTAPFPFPVLSDIDPELGIPVPAHQIWGLGETEGRPPRSGLFLIDRSGYTEFSLDREGSPGRPVAVRDLEVTLGRLGKGEWPL
ncbi:peroxiredoxin family protein [Caulifigura coniformis]|nr:redoxin domain-containing protein [Caulifigura coniformis]